MSVTARLVGLVASLAMVHTSCFQEAIDPRADPDEGLPTLIDIDPDPNVVHVSLVAAEATVSFLDGKPTNVWAYLDGNAPDATPSVPGPTLLAKPGDLVLLHGGQCPHGALFRVGLGLPDPPVQR